MSYTPNTDRTYNPNALQTQNEFLDGFEGNTHFFTAKLPASKKEFACQKSSCAIEIKKFGAMPGAVGKPELANNPNYKDHVKLVVNK